MDLSQRQHGQHWSLKRFRVLGRRRTDSNTERQTDCDAEELGDDSHVKSRISQYETLKDGKGINIAKQVVIAKILGQDHVLKKYGLRQHDLMSMDSEIWEANLINSDIANRVLSQAVFFPLNVQECFLFNNNFTQLVQVLMFIILVFCSSSKRAGFSIIYRLYKS